MLLVQDVKKTKVKNEISPLWTVTLLLTYLGCYLMIKLCLFSPFESFLSLCCFSATQAPNGLRSIKLTAFNKAVQYLNI